MTMTMTRNSKAGFVAAVLAAVAVVGVLPGAAFAQRGRESRIERQRREEAEKRQKTKNDWRNLAIAAGGIAAFGAIKGDPYIGFGGLAGALYSMNRYEQDRKSQSATDRARSSIFSQPYIYRDGKRYERRIVTKNGQRYYQFVRR